MNKDKYVILDLDNTLLQAHRHHALEKRIVNERTIYIKLNCSQEEFRITLRNNLDTFLNQLHSRGYKVIVWSAGARPYVLAIYSFLKARFPGVFSYVLTRDHVRDDKKHLIDIEGVIPNFSMERAILLDDLVDHRIGQEKYVLPAEPFEFEKHDHVPSDNFLLYAADLIDEIFAKRVS